MKPSIADQLQFLTRTVNPDYLIIIQNKANETMDFSQFKTNLPEVKEKKVRERRYIILVIDEWTEVQSKIIVKDTYFNNRIVFDSVCKKEKVEHNLIKVKDQYKGDILEKI